jgi:hypothetical protein
VNRHGAVELGAGADARTGGNRPDHGSPAADCPRRAAPCLLVPADCVCDNQAWMFSPAGQPEHGGSRST